MAWLVRKLCIFCFLVGSSIFASQVSWVSWACDEGGPTRLPHAPAWTQLPIELPPSLLPATCLQVAAATCSFSAHLFLHPALACSFHPDSNSAYPHYTLHVLTQVVEKSLLQGTREEKLLSSIAKVARSRHTHIQLNAIAKAACIHTHTHTHTILYCYAGSCENPARMAVEKFSQTLE